MDPVGAAASALTLLAAGNAICDFISALYNAPQELVALQNERTNLKSIFEAIAAHTNEAILARDDGKVIRPLCDQAQDAIRDLDKFVQRIETPLASNFAPHLRRIRWAAKYKSKAETILKKLSTVRQNLVAALAAKTLLIDRNSDKVGNVHTSVLEAISNVKAGSDNQVTALEVVIERQIQQGHALQIGFRQLSRALQTDIVSQASTSADLNNRLTLQDKMLQIIHEEIRDNRVQQTGMQAAVSPQPYIELLSRCQNVTCPKSCRCVCHAKSVLSTPDTLHSLLGNGFGDFKTSLKTVKCTLKTCASDETTSVKAAWVLPTWIATKVASVAVVKAQNCALTIHLKARAYSRDENLHRYVEQGDLHNVRALIKSRNVALDEIESGYGQSALVWAINRVKIELCELLLNEKADVMLEDFSGRTPKCVALMQIVIEARTKTKESLINAAQLKTLFWDDTGFEEMDWTLLHEIVLGFKMESLEKALIHTEVDINHQDRAGRTALYWAAAGNDVNALQILSDNGADPDLADNHGSTPMNAASVVKDGAQPVAMRLLLKHKASLRPAKLSGFTPLLHAAYHKNNVAFIEPLIAAGCDPNHTELRGMNALARAALKDQDSTARFLIKHEANINSVDKQGYSVVATAIQSGATKVTRLLFEAGADYTRCNSKNQTILHLAAASSRTNVGTLKVMHSACLRGIEVNALDNQGHTALDLLSRRENCSLEFRQMFFTLIQYITPDIPSTDVPEESLDHVLTMAMS